MAKVYLMEIQEMAKTVGNRTRYTFTNTNDKSEEIMVELTRCYCSEQYSLGRIWKEKQWISEDLETWIYVDVYVTDTDGNCWGKYNPQHTREGKVDFKWVLEDTPANRQKILTEIAKKAKIKEC